MRHLHYLEIKNFKRFSDPIRIELDHPSVLVGPNNCGKTTALQAIALWSQAVRTWFGKQAQTPPTKRTATGLYHREIVAVPVGNVRDFWHTATDAAQPEDVPFDITLGVAINGRVEPVTMRFQFYRDDTVDCAPAAETLELPDFIAAAAALNVRLLFPMSGMEIEEPLIQPGRVSVLLGMGQTARTLRNLCMELFWRGGADWGRVRRLMNRLFAIELDDPLTDVGRGEVVLTYRQNGDGRSLDIALAGRGLQQTLLLLAYMHLHPRSVLLIDEPDAHLEILRQRQIFTLLRDEATRHGTQVVLATHSEVLLGEAIEGNLTLLQGGTADQLADKAEIVSALRHYGAEHYLRARQRGYVFYVEGSTDLALLRALAERLGHPVAGTWNDAANVYYVRDTHPTSDEDAKLERAEEGFGLKQDEHFFSLRRLLPGLTGLAILDRNGRLREDSSAGGLTTSYWRRYEIENYVVNPEVLRAYVASAYQDLPLFDEFGPVADEIIDDLSQERVFRGKDESYRAWESAEPTMARLLWQARAENTKLSDFAEEFFRRLAKRLGHAMLLRKRDLHQLVPLMPPGTIAPEVSDKLDLLAAIFQSADPHDAPD